MTKTAGKENQKRCVNEAASRDHGTEGQNDPAQRGGLEGKKKSSRRRSVFFSTPFIELIRQVNFIGEKCKIRQTESELRKESLQLSVFGFSGDEDGDVGVFPQREKVFVGG